MTCYGVGAGITVDHGEASAAGLPEDVPPDQTNM
jgi:hypothetical protein